MRKVKRINKNGEGNYFIKSIQSDFNAICLDKKAVFFGKGKFGRNLRKADMYWFDLEEEKDRWVLEHHWNIFKLNKKETNYFRKLAILNSL
jgi:hypothetical protein